MQAVTVKIFRGTTLVANKERPLRRTPDGQFGVTYRGAVYPVDENGNVQLLSPSFDAYQCELATSLPPSWTQAAKSATHFDDSGRFKYLMLNGTEGMLQSVLDTLAEHSVDVYSSGPSRREADDGVQYDWYIRLGETIEPSTLRYIDPMPPVGASNGNRLSVAVEDHSELATLRSEFAIVTEKHRLAQAHSLATQRGLEERLRALEAEAIELRTAATVKDAEIRRANSSRDDLIAAIQRLKAGRDDGIGRAAALEEELARTRRELEQALDTSQRATISLREAEDIGNSYNNEAQALKGRLEMAEERAEDAEGALQELQREGATRVVGSKAALLRDRLSAMLCAAYPSVRLVRDSLEFVVDDLSDFQSICSLLQQICFQPERVRAEAVKSAPGWMERHFSTGSAADGRLYFRRVNGDCEALLSSKGRQERDIAWLKKQ